MISGRDDTTGEFERRYSHDVVDTLLAYCRNADIGLACRKVNGVSVRFLRVANGQRAAEKLH